MAALRARPEEGPQRPRGLRRADIESSTRLQCEMLPPHRELDRFVQESATGLERFEVWSGPAVVSGAGLRRVARAAQGPRGLRRRRGARAPDHRGLHLRRLQEPHEEAHELELVHAVRPARRDARRGAGTPTPRRRTNPRPSASSRSRWRSPSPPARARRATAAPHRRRTAGRGAHRRAAPSQQEKAGPHEPRGALLPRAAVGQANVDVISESAAAARCFESAARVRCALPRAHTHK